MQPYRISIVAVILNLLTFPAANLLADETSDSPPPPAQVQTEERSDAATDEKPSKSESHSETKSTKEIDDLVGSSDVASADEMAVREVGASFVKSFCAANADELAAHFTSTGEYVDEHGNVFQGRAVISRLMNSTFEENQGCHLELSTDSIRFLADGLAVEDGQTLFTHVNDVGDDDEEDGVVGRYTTIYTKIEGKWQIASIRKQAVKTSRRHRSELEQLSWLQGDWVDESDESVVLFSCQPTDRGNFLIRKFVIHVEGQEIMNGTQRIGWDPLTGKLKAWIFDSEGGYAEGHWYRDGDSWKLKAVGVTAEGEPASSTSIYTCINNDTMVWQSVDHEIGGVMWPDSEPVTIVRRAPTPDMADSASHSDTH